MKSRLTGLLVLLFGVMFVLGCGERKLGEKEKAKLAAKVEDWTITRQEIDEMIEKLPDHQKKKYDTPAGRAEIADKLIAEELFYREGRKRGFEEKEEVQKKIKDAVRNIIISEFHKRVLVPKASPSEEEMHDFYESNLDRFTTRVVLRAQHIFSKDKKKLYELKERIENGEKMTALAHEYSEDKITRKDGGDLGYFNPGGYIRFIGYSKEFSEAVENLEPGVVSDPIKFSKGYSIVRVNERRPGRLRPYEEVKPEIERTIVNQRIDQVKEDMFDKLKKAYEVNNFIEEELQLTQRSPEELWKLAQASTDSYQRLRAYKEIVEKFPESNYAAQALFMVGFVYAEELKDEYNADRVFNRVLRDFPDSDVAKSAKWMLDNLGKPIPDFEDLDELNKKLSDRTD